MTEKKRESYLDIAKGLGIIFVILGHLDIGAPRVWLYSFHLPLFFIIAGICFNQSVDFLTFIKKKARRCLIPYVVFGLLIALVESKTGFLYETGLKNNLTRLLLQERYSTLWFLATLFLAYIIFYGIVKLCRNHELIILALTIVLSVIFIYLDQNHIRALYWNLDTSFIVLGFMGFGYFIKNHHMILNSLLSCEGRRKGLLICLLLILNLVCFASNLLISQTSLEMYWNSYGNYPLMFGAAVFGTLFILVISASIKWTPIEKLGKNSMTYFALHQSVFMGPLTLLFKQINLITFEPGINNIIAKILIFILTIILCAIVDTILRNTKLKKILGE